LTYANDFLKTFTFGAKTFTFLARGGPILHAADLTSCRSYPLLLSLSYTACITVSQYHSITVL